MFMYFSPLSHLTFTSLASLSPSYRSLSIGWTGGGGRDGSVAREHLSPANVTWVRVPASTPYMGWVYRWFSSLLQKVLVRVIRFSTPLKKQHFQFPVRCEKCLQLVEGHRQKTTCLSPKPCMSELCRIAYLVNIKILRPGINNPRPDPGGWIGWLATTVG